MWDHLTCSSGNQPHEVATESAGGDLAHRPLEDTLMMTDSIDLRSSRSPPRCGRPSGSWRRPALCCRWTSSSAGREFCGASASPARLTSSRWRGGWPVRSAGRRSQLYLPSPTQPLFIFHSVPACIEIFFLFCLVVFFFFFFFELSQPHWVTVLAQTDIFLGKLFMIVQHNHAVRLHPVFFWGDVMSKLSCQRTRHRYLKRDVLQMDVTGKCSRTTDQVVDTEIRFRRWEFYWYLDTIYLSLNSSLSVTLEEV